ncbi:MAG: hypothetical protein M3P51_00910 [Chloroflexota bacterium]|nr:hypothetical protein [Chloroflexota bacterium]
MGAFYVLISPTATPPTAVGIMPWRLLVDDYPEQDPMPLRTGGLHGRRTFYGGDELQALEEDAREMVGPEDIA